MTQPLLSILIPTVVGREEKLQRLHNVIAGQLTDRTASMIEVIDLVDNKEMTIGEKRERLYQIATGVFVFQPDDDDLISGDFLERVVLALEEQPDCVTYEEKVIMDGVEFRSNHLLSYPDWDGDGSRLLFDGFHFHRTPFFKSVIKASIAKATPVVSCRYGEDHLFAQAIKPKLKTEIHISSQLYIYEYISSPFNERYGII